MDIPEGHEAAFIEAVRAADILLMVEIDTQDIRLQYSETTDPRLTAKILRDIAQALDDAAPELRKDPVIRN